MPSLPRLLTAGVLACLLAAGLGSPALAGGPADEPAAGAAPGAPGVDEQFLPADKSGVGTSASTTSKVWLTVQRAGGLGELYYPDIGTPAARALQFVIADRDGHAVRADDAARGQTVLADAGSLTYRQTFQERGGRWRLTATYVTDPARASVVVDLAFAAADAHRFTVYAVYDPSLSNTRM